MQKNSGMQIIVIIILALAGVILLLGVFFFGKTLLEAQKLPLPGEAVVTTMPLELPSITVQPSEIVFPSQTPTVTLTPIPSVTPTPTISPTASITATLPPGEPILPAALYYIASPAAGEVAQVWRIERDGRGFKQVTFEEYPVTGLDISRKTGMIAYVSGNRLMVAENDGSHARLLTSFEQPAPGVEEDLWAKEISQPLWAPDGETLAYALSGIHLIDIKSAEDVTIAKNAIPGSRQEISNLSLFYPVLWRADGKRLFVERRYYEDNALASMLPKAGAMAQRLVDACCQVSMGVDGKSIFLGNSDRTYADLGLWQINSKLEVRTIIADNGLTSGLFTYAAHPAQAEDGRISFFYTQAGAADEPIFRLASIMPIEGTEVQFLSEPVYTANDMLEALWAADASLVVIQGIGKPMLLVPANGEATVVIPAIGKNLRWGKTE